MRLSQLPSGEITEQHKPFTLTFKPLTGDLSHLESPIHPKCILFWTQRHPLWVQKTEDMQISHRKDLGPEDLLALRQKIEWKENVKC